MKVPFATWLNTYGREWLRGDVVAGLTAAAVVIPKAMAYALIAGLGVEAGLYTALAAMLVYPLLGSSRLLSMTTTSAVAMLTAAAVAAASQAHGAEPAAAAATLAVLAGGVLIAARLLRLGFLADFLSLPVLVGYQAGVGIVIAVTQLEPLLGVDVGSRGAVGILLELPGVSLWLAGVNPGVKEVLARSPLAAGSDPSRLFANLHKVIDAWQRDTAPA